MRLTSASEEELPNKSLWEEQIPLFVNYTLLGGTNLPLITAVKRIKRKVFYNIHNPPILIVVAITIQQSHFRSKRDQVREQLRLKHYSYRTEETYIHWIKRYILFHSKRHPNEMGDDEIRAFLIHLAEKEEVAASTQNQAFSALLFLYRHVLHKELMVDFKSIGASRSKHLPTVLTKEETQRVIDYLNREYQLVAKMLYGSGLRVSECLRLRVKDIDFDYKTVTIYDGKGEKDRVTVLPESLIPLLKVQLDRVRRIYESDKNAQLPGVSMPSSAWARKYPHSSRE